MSDPKHARLGDVTEITKGVSYQGQFLTSDGLPLVNLRCIERGGGFRTDGLKPYSGPYKDQHVVVPGDLVLANTDLTQDGRIIGCPAIVPAFDHDAGFGLISHHLCRARAIDDAALDISFLYYVLRGPWFRAHAQGVASGTTVLGFRTDDIEAFELDLPPLLVQRRVARLLGSFDDLIENNRRRIAGLEEAARLVYREWFVHYRFPGHKDAKLVDSDLGPTPLGWEMKAVGDVADLVRGRSYRGTELVVAPEGRPFLNLKCIDRGGGFRKSGLKRYDGAFKEEQLALPGDTVIAVTDMTQERNIVAQAARVPRLPEGSGVISLDLARVLPSDAVDGDYLYAMFRYSSFSSAVKEHANGTNVLHLSPDRIREFAFMVPPVELQKSFGDVVRPMYGLVDNLELQSETLAQARDVLLPRLISGELDVSCLDLDLEPVA